MGIYYKRQGMTSLSIRAPKEYNTCFNKLVELMNKGDTNISMWREVWCLKFYHIVDITLSCFVTLFNLHNMESVISPFHRQGDFMRELAQSNLVEEILWSYKHSFLKHFLTIHYCMHRKLFLHRS